jgi:hypothetical protein
MRPNVNAKVASCVNCLLVSKIWWEISGPPVSNLQVNLFPEIRSKKMHVFDRIFKKRLRIHIADQ